MCNLGQLMPWNGEWDIPGVVDPTDLVTSHLTPGNSEYTMWDIPGLVDPIDHISSQLTPENSVSLNVDEPELFVANILREPAVVTERYIHSSVQTQRLDAQIPFTNHQIISTKP